MLTVVIACMFCSYDYKDFGEMFKRQINTTFGMLYIIGLLFIYRALKTQ